MKNESSLEFYISNAGVESDRNYTCIPFNKVSNTFPKLSSSRQVLCSYTQSNVSYHRKLCLTHRVVLDITESNVLHTE